MALSFGNDHVFAAEGNQSTPYTSAATTLNASTTAIVVCITIYDTSSSDGVVSDVDFGTLDLTSSIVFYDALSDGHVSLWYGNSPQLTSQTLDIVMGGTCTDFKCSITEIYGGEIQERDVPIGATGTSGDVQTNGIDVEFDDLVFACMLDDQTDVAKVHAVRTEIYTEDVGDVVGAQRWLSASSATEWMTWTEDDGDEDWVAVGASYYELPGAILVYKDVQAKWDMRELVNDDLQIKYDMFELINDDIQAKWDIFDLVNQDTQAKWDIFELVGQEVQAKWDMRELVGQNIEAVWDILSLATQVFKDIQAKWDIRELVNQSIEAKYDIFELIGDELQAKWDILNLAGQELQAKWDISVLVTKSIEAKWDILNLVAKNIQAVYDMRELVGRSLQAKWDILNGAPPAEGGKRSLRQTAYRWTSRMGR